MTKEILTRDKASNEGKLHKVKRIWILIHHDDEGGITSHGFANLRRALTFIQEQYYLGRERKKPNAPTNSTSRGQ